MAIDNFWLPFPAWLTLQHRLRDWLHGARLAQPDASAQNALTKEPLKPAERYRLVHEMITAEPRQGGAGITPQHGEWNSVEALFPLHNARLNNEWMTEWARKTFLTPEDIDSVRDNLGEKVGLDPIPSQKMPCKGPPMMC